MIMTTRVLKAIQTRLSRGFAVDRDSAKALLKEVMHYRAQYGDNEYFELYLEFLRNYVKRRSGLRRWYPTHLSAVSLNEYRAFSKGEKLVFKDIAIPFCEYGATHIIDSLLPYLLSEVDVETLYQFYGISEGPYEYKSVKLNDGNLNDCSEGGIVIDAGACVGEFSALAGVKGCKVYAFEPMPHIIDRYLKKTAAWNPNISIYPYALSDKKAELTFYENEVGDSSAIMKMNRNSKITVPAIDLDTFVAEHHLPRVDFIKADIEGAERYMLMGARKVLREFAPKLSLCTYHLPDDPQVMREIILDANPDYVIEERWKKMYAWVPNERASSD